MKEIKYLLKIILNTYREIIRDRVLYNILFFAVIIIGSSYLVSEWAALAREKVIKDFALVNIELFGLIIGVFTAINFIYKEIDKRTIYIIISKPIPRYFFIIGKYLGLSLVLFLNTIFLSLVSFILFVYFGFKFDINFLQAVILIYVEILTVIAFTTLFSTFTTPFLSLVYTVLIVVLGKLSYDITLYAQNLHKKGHIFYAKLLDTIYYIVPNLENFNIRNLIVHSIPVDGDYIKFALYYGFFYILFVLTIASIIFSRRDFK